jgi:hypothetical protein
MEQKELVIDFERVTPLLSSYKSRVTYAIGIIAPMTSVQGKMFVTAEEPGAYVILSDPKGVKVYEYDGRAWSEVNDNDEYSYFLDEHLRESEE